MSKTKIIVLCGSSRFIEIMFVASWLLEKNEHVITMGLHLLPNWYTKDIPHHLTEHENVADQMDKLYFKKIDLADEIFVINAEGYIGESTLNEINYAMSKGLKIRYYDDDILSIQIKDIMLNYLDKLEAGTE